MKDPVQPDPEKTTTQDAEITAETMVGNPKIAPNIDFEDDYELAQKMSHSSEDIPEEEDVEGLSSPSLQ